MELTQEQKDWLDECTQGSWSLNKKGLVDIDGDFYCTRQDLKDFKGVKFGVVKGSFLCICNKLTSLEGAPQVVRGRFDCSYNKLTSLVGAPQVVRGSFYCENNQLTSLVGAPQEVEGSFDCIRNQLTSLVGAPQKFRWFFDCRHNKLTSLEGAPQKFEGYFYCSYNPISETTLKLIHKTMIERDVPYIIALGLLRIRINKEEFDKLSSGYNEGSLNAASIMSRFV